MVLGNNNYKEDLKCPKGSDRDGEESRREDS